jgi:hypothetical protein
MSAIVREPVLASVALSVPASIFFSPGGLAS